MRKKFVSHPALFAMMDKSHMSLPKHRIAALDGLRGLAILMVILNHLHLGLLYTSTPGWFHPIVSMIINSGSIGVLIFFMLSGYLMATIYPTVPSAFDFWQKRYTRIFPAFVVMCIALAIIKWQWNQFSPLALSAVLIVAMAIGGFLWRCIQRSPHRARIGKIIFLGFLIVQILTVISYIVLQMRVPSAVYFIVWPATVRTAMNALVNMTMTIPFGTYVGQLDGVYWSVIAEVSFYLLYPIILLPGIQLIRQTKSTVTTIISIVLLFPLCFGLYMLYQHIYFFSMLQIHLILYFIAGAIIGGATGSPVVKRFHAMLIRLPSVIPLGVALLSIFAGIFIPTSSIVKNFLIVFPLSLGFLITLSHQTVWARVLRTPFFIWLGTVSYSLYLTHSIAIEIVGRYGEPATLYQMITRNLFVVGLIGIFGYVLHVTMERPYFLHPKGLLVQSKQQLQKFTHAASIRFILAACLVIFLVWYGYSVPTSFATLVVNMSNNNLPRLVPITPVTLTIPFVATYDNLGMLKFAIRPLAKEEMTRLGYMPGANLNAHLIAAITDKTGRRINITAYPLYQIYESKFFTIGLPIETQSRDKQYQLHLSIDQSDANTYMALVNTNVTLREIYVVKKTDLLKKLPLMGEVLWNKFSLPFTEPEPLIVLFCCLPMCITLTIISHRYQLSQR